MISMSLEYATERIVGAVGPKSVTVSVGISLTSSEVLTPARYFSASLRSASITVWANVGEDDTPGQKSIDVLTTRTSKIDPPDALARRAATGITRSARDEPSKAMRMRSNIDLLLLVVAVVLQFI